MPLLRDCSIFDPVSCFISVDKDSRASKENIRVTSNTISILDHRDQIIEEITPAAKIMPVNIQTQQVNERTLINCADAFIAGKNVSVLLIGSAFSGKEKLFDGSKNELPLAHYFLGRVMGMLKGQFGRHQLRLSLCVVIKEKVYDCLSEDKYVPLKLRLSEWEGPEISNVTVAVVEQIQDLTRELTKGIKQKNKIVLEFKDLYTSYLEVSLCRKFEETNTIVSKLTIFQIPGVEILNDSHKKLKDKEGSLSTRSLLGFTSIVNELNNNPDALPQCDSCVLGVLLKQILCGNSLLNVYFTLRSEDIQGSLATMKFMRIMSNMQQYPIVNEGRSMGLLRRFRALGLQKKAKIEDRDLQDERKIVENEMSKLQSEEDYKRIVEKYAQLKSKYNGAVRRRSEAQLDLIKCEQEKLEMGKCLVEVQIENTKLLEKLQNKDYENGKRVLNTENLLMKKESSYQECVDKIGELTLSLNEALETKRDLEIEFIAIKRNYIMRQTELATLKDDNQALSLDVINITNQNERLKRDFSAAKPEDRSKIVTEMQNEKYEQAKREAKKQQDTISYLKSEIERYKRDLLQRDSPHKSKVLNQSRASYAADYDRIEIENQNMELINRAKLYQRKIQEFQEKVGYYAEENQHLDHDNKQLRIQNQKDTEEYRGKLEQFTKHTNQQAVVRELKANFLRKDKDNLAAINILKREEINRKNEIADLKGYIRELTVLLEEWGPKGVELPSLAKFKEIGQLDSNSSDLRIRNIRLEEEVRRLREDATYPMKESRVNSQYRFLKDGTKDGTKELSELREDRSKLQEQNRRLTVMLKDGNKMDLNILKRQNEQLRKEIESLRSQSSISPSTSDQKLIFYEKHIKGLERERSELLSRCVVAEEQVKNMLGKIGRVKG